MRLKTPQDSTTHSPCVFPPGVLGDLERWQLMKWSSFNRTKGYSILALIWMTSCVRRDYLLPSSYSFPQLIATATPYRGEKTGRGWRTERDVVPFLYDQRKWFPNMVKCPRWPYGRCNHVVFVTVKLLVSFNENKKNKQSTSLRAFAHIGS